MEALGAELARELCPGSLVLISGPLGAGKTTLVRGILRSLGHAGAVRSPTFNLLQAFDTDPPVLHVDLYRVESAVDLGIEDYWASHAVLVEWPERAGTFFEGAPALRVEIAPQGTSRRVGLRSYGRAASKSPIA